MCIVLLRRFSTHIVLNIQIGLRLNQYPDHFRVAILGCPMKRCVTILWGKALLKTMASVTITYIVFIVDISTIVDK